MRRAAIVAAALIAAAIVLFWWRSSAPGPGESLFADWRPGANGKAWSIAGQPNSGKWVFVDPSGAYQPRRDSYSVHFFLYDRDRGRLCTPTFRGIDSLYDLIPVVTWRGIGELRGPAVRSRWCRSEALITNGGRSMRRLSLFVVAVPYQIAGPLRGSEDVSYDTRSRSVVVGGKVLFSCEDRPDAHAAFGAPTGPSLCDITGYVGREPLPRSRSAAGGPRVITSAAVRYDIVLAPGRGRRIVIASPTEPTGLAKWSKLRYADSLPGIGSRLNLVGLEVPDKRCERCFRASVGYLTLLMRDGNPAPGPTKYRGFWVRDCAYMADALYYSGQQDLIPRALETIRKMQLPNGGFPPKLDTKKDDELDAPGESIYAFVQYYRRTHDREWLRRQWSCIEAACRYIRDERAGGILPASVSAEDLGEELRQHYWDDFWCVRGLRDAAYAANVLGKPGDAKWISAEADSLLSATRASIREAMAKHSIEYVPNGPDEVTSSAMARGTSCALWPCAVLDPDDRLTRTSFEVYWRKWIAPSGGGFVHKGNYWPYAGLDLAQGYLMLGQRERAWKILDWTLAHDPTDGFYAWPEGMSRDGLGLAEGDMPHGWMCAAYVSLVRNMLVRESGGDLVLLSGAPKRWLQPGAVVSAERFPTEFGPVSYRAVVGGGVVKLSISGARPKGSYRVCLPGRADVILSSYTRSASIPLR